MTIRNGSKLSQSRPLSSYSSTSSNITSTLSKQQINKSSQLQPANVDVNASGFYSPTSSNSTFFSPCSSINDSFRKKSGSVSALYLCDTASTKAKKAESKHALNDQISKDSDHQQLVQSQSNSQPTSHHSINRRNSMGKKASVERSGNLNCSLTQQQGMNNECPLKKQQQSSTNVFDRLSRSSKKMI